MSRRAIGRACVLALVALGGCGPMYMYGQTGKTIGDRKPDDCHFPLLEAPPSRPFDELGVVAPEDIEYGSMADTTLEFENQIRRYVCAAGGDAVVVEKNKWARFERGTVIKYR
jgi:hypothetical protein